MRTAPIALLSIAISGTASAASMRCDKWVVNETASVSELVEKCGEPASKEVEKQDVLGRNATTRGTYKIGETVIERWLYRRGTQSLPMLVTIIDGKIHSIERAD